VMLSNGKEPQSNVAVLGRMEVCNVMLSSQKDPQSNVAVLGRMGLWCMMISSGMGPLCYKGGLLEKR
jgi:hypothetical protein